MTMVAAPGGQTFYPEAKETKEEAELRYQSIAKDLLEVVWDSDEKPLFKGPDGRARTLAMMLGIMRFESGLRRDVDYQLGKYAFGDGGASACLMQVRVGSGKTPEGWTKEDLKDRKKCFRAALHVLHASFKACRFLPEEYRLSAYTSGVDKLTGKCVAKNASKIRYNEGKKIFESNAVPGNDSEIMEYKLVE